MYQYEYRNPLCHKGNMSIIRTGLWASWLPQIKEGGPSPVSAGLWRARPLPGLCPGTPARVPRCGSPRLPLCAGWRDADAAPATAPPGPCIPQWRVSTGSRCRLKLYSKGSKCYIYWNWKNAISFAFCVIYIITFKHAAAIITLKRRMLCPHFILDQ